MHMGAWSRQGPRRNTSHCLPQPCAAVQKFDEASIEFQQRISYRNGLSMETYLPPALHAKPPVITMEGAREEARMVLFGAVEEVLQRTGVPSTHYTTFCDALVAAAAGWEGWDCCGGGVWRGKSLHPTFLMRAAEKTLQGGRVV